MASDSMAFQNFATGYYDSTIDADSMVRMFGTGVCANAQSPCRPTPVANAWMNKANESMTGGRCEGFAVLSDLLFSADLNAVDFGGLDARSLKLDGNVALQREIAYWFSTQLIPEVVSARTKSLMASDVMPFLAEQLKPGASELWRIGIVRKHNGKLGGGHALTPIGYYSGEREGLYYLRVYDNNNPDTERAITIDTKANRWEYEAARNPKAKSSLYYGDSSNTNPLYFAPVRSRLGTLPCPFCAGAGSTVVQTTGGVEAILNTAGGATGVQGGELVATGGGSVSPVLTDDLEGEPAAMIVAVPVAGDAHISLRNGSDDPSASGAGTLVAFGEGYLVALEGLALSAESTDALAISGGGTSVKYESSSQTPLSMSTLVQGQDGSALQVSVTVAGASAGVEISVDSDTGEVTVKTRQADEASITVGVTQTRSDGSSESGQLSYQGTGEDTLSVQTASLESTGVLTGEVTDDSGAVTPLTDSCSDGKLSGLETDVDCGGGCPEACAVGEHCVKAQDCLSTFCQASAGLCVETGCEDGTRGQEETDVDCGGSRCAACDVDRACVVDRDCDSGACEVQRCVPTFSIGFTVSGLPAGATIVLQNNGGDDLLVDADGSHAFPRRVTGAYEVTIVRPPGIAECAVANGSGIAVADVTDVMVACVPLWSIGGTLSGLPAGDSLVLTNNGTDVLTLAADGAFAFAGLVKDTYHAALSVQPVHAFCVLEHGDGTATSNVTDLTVTCSLNCAGAALDCGHGSCSDLLGAAECVCDTGYAGPTCGLCAAGYQDHDADGTCLPTCASSGLGNCSGHGTCADSSGAAACTCDAGYAGASCASCAAGYQDQDADGTCLADCASSGLGNCSGHGTCSDSSGTATCSCEAGYAGASCASCAAGYQDHDTDGTCLADCASSGLGNCDGHGTCSDATGTATCACDPGYAGASCASCAAGYQDHDADGTCLVDCASSGLGSCSGHGTCQDATGPATCVCTTPWIGTACDTIGPFTTIFGGAGGERAVGVAADPGSGNIYVLLGTNSPTMDFGGGVTVSNYGQSDVYLLALSPVGTALWALNIGGVEREDAMKMVIDSSGNVVLTGSTYSSTIYFDATNSAPAAMIRPFVVSYTSAGAFRWARVFGSGEASAIAADRSGNVFVTGSAAGDFDYDDAGPLPTLTPGANGVYLVSLDAGGATRWANVYGSDPGGSGSRIRDLATDAAGNVYGTGYVGAPNASFGGGPLAFNATCNCTEIFVASWGNDGAHRWSKGFPGINGRSYDAFAIALDDAGRVALGAQYADALDFGGGTITHPNPGYAAGALVLFDAATGAFRSQRLFETGIPFVIYDVAFGASGLHMVGNSNNFGGDLGAGPQPSGAFWARYSLGAADAIEFGEGRVAGGGAYPLATGICETPEGAVLAVGETAGNIDWGSGVKTTSGSWDAWLARLK
ncbi:MAG: hypothetical protein HY901_00925 [Deltaproteobacteria bacterium]|nr:hypothetical protein [Deltaproteobacteria bacterium]